jgi:hypothetical protein
MAKKTKTKHSVTFYSPGTLFDESTDKDIDKWDVDKAVEMARKVTERYNAKPFGFQFFTEELKKQKNGETRYTVIKESKMYYLGGTILTLADIKARKDKKDDILISNMEGNDIKTIIQNDNSWRITRPFDSKKDVLLEVKL